MRIASRDRLWLLGGLIAALLLTVLVWQFFIKSQNDKTNSVKGDITAAQQQVLDSTHQLNQLKADSANLAKYQAALAADQAALPTDTGMPAFLNELHDAGAQTSVGIVSLTVGQPVPVTGAQAGTAGAAVTDSLQLTLNATGTSDNLTAFLKQIQTVQPRAVLLTSVQESPSAGGLDALQLAFEVFTTPSTTAAQPAADRTASLTITRHLE